MTRRKRATLLLVAVAAVGGLIAVFVVPAPERASTPGAGEKRHLSFGQLVDAMPGIRLLVDGAPRVRGCKDRDRDHLCRIEGPTGLHALCFFPERNTTIDASCSRFETPGADGKEEASRTADQGPTAQALYTQALDTPHDCLVSLGAVVAQRSEEIPFYRRDLMRDLVNNPAGAGRAGYVIGESSPIAENSPDGPGPPPAYLVWVGGPATEDPPDILEYADDLRPDTFVAYLRDPSREQFRRGRRCLDKFGNF